MKYKIFETMNIDFTEIPVANKGGKDQDTFELFASDFLESLGYDIIQRPSRGPDGKKDLIVQSNSVPGTTSDSKTKWLVSCKHNAHSGKGVSDTDEPDISDRLNKHKCHGFLGFYSTIPNTTLSEKLASMSERFVSTIYDHSRIEKEIHSLKDKERILATYFPKSRENIIVEQKPVNDIVLEERNVENLLEISRTALIQIEIAKIKYEFDYSWNNGKDQLYSLRNYVDFANETISNYILEFLHLQLTSLTLSGMPTSVAYEINSLVLIYFPYRFREKSDNQIVAVNHCLGIGFNLVYDALLYSNNFRIAQIGLSIWKFIYRESKRNNHSEIMDLVITQYKEIEQTLERPERNDLENAKEMLQIFKEDLETYSLAFPPLPEHLYELTLKSDKI